MSLDRNVVIAVGLAFVMGFITAGKWEQPQPANDRPVLRWIARAAKSLLWVALVAEKSPESDSESQHLVHARAGADGHQIVDHARGW